MATTKLEMDILSILCEDARISAEKIAAMLNADEEQVRACISKLEDENVIIKYRTLVDWEKVDDDKVEAWIEVRVSPQKNEGFDAIAERITGYPPDDFVENRRRTYMSLIHPDDRDRVERDVWEAIDAGRQFELEHPALVAEIPLPGT